MTNKRPQRARDRRQPGGVPSPLEQAAAAAAAGGRPQQMQGPPPMQEVYPVTAMNVQDTDDGQRLLTIRIPAPNKLMIIPMTQEEAEDIGKKLSAPSILVPKAGVISAG